MLQWSLVINLLLSSGIVKARPAILRSTETSHPGQTFHGSQCMGPFAARHTYSSGSSLSRDHLTTSSNSMSAGFSNWISISPDQSYQSDPKLSKGYDIVHLDLPNRFKHLPAENDKKMLIKSASFKKARVQVSGPTEFPERANCLEVSKDLCPSGASWQEIHVADIPSEMMVDDCNNRTPGAQSHWQKLYSNVHKIKLLGQEGSPEDGDKKPTSPGVFWQKLYWNRHRLKFLSRDENLTSLPEQILRFWWKMTKSFKGIKGSEDDSVDVVSKGKMELDQQPAEEATTSTQANNLETLPFTSVKDSQENVSKSHHHPNLTPHPISNSLGSPQQMAAKKHWCSAANKLRAVNAFGGVNRAIHATDNFLKRMDRMIKFIDDSLVDVDKIGQQFEELENFIGLKNNQLGNL